MNALIWNWLEAEIFALPSVDGERPLFNFYHAEDTACDRPGAARQRRENLRRWLWRYPAAPDTLVVGEAPGWRGCRFTGVPFTSEALLAAGNLPGAASAAFPPTSRPERRWAEASATLFWQALQPYSNRVLAWNCVPLHPHRPGNPLSNRPPTAAEIRRFLPQLFGLIALLQPARVLAVGRCAQAALQAVGVPALPVRHPSHGGARQFARDVAAALAN
jgi:uracil-DNA glycosylase